MQLNSINSFLLVIKKISRNLVGRNALSNLVGRLWSAALSLLTVPIFISYLGPEAYGLVGLYASFEVIFTFLDLGLSATVNREIARNIGTGKPGQESKNLLRTFEYFYWAIGFGVAFLIAVFAGWIAHNWVIIDVLSPEQVQKSIYMMALMFAARWPMNLYIGAFRGLQKQFLQNIISIAAATLRVITALFILIFISNQVTIFLFWQAISCGMEILFLLIFSWRELNKISQERPRIDLRIIKQVWKFALSFNLVGVLGMILSSAGSLIASKFVNLSEIGYYSVASTAAGSMTLIAYSIGNALYPRFAANTARNDSNIVRNDFHRSVRVINYFTFAFCSILILFPSYILYLWTRDENIVFHTSLLLIFLASASLFNSMANPSYSLLVASGNTRIPLLCNLVNLLVFIPALVILLPIYGIVSAAICWLLENVISYFVYTYFAWKYILKESPTTYFIIDIIPYLLICLIWFLSGKILCLLLNNTLIELFVIVIVTIGYFLSMAPRIIKDVSFKDPECVYP